VELGESELFEEGLVCPWCFGPLHAMSTELRQKLKIIPAAVLPLLSYYPYELPLIIVAQRCCSCMLLLFPSLLVGVWHLGVTTALLGDDLAGLALLSPARATVGLLLRIIAGRTPSLLAPTVTHIVIILLG